MEYGMEDFWYGMEMKWKKIACMEYGKIVFHSIPYHTLGMTTMKRSCFYFIIAFCKFHSL